MSSGNFAAYRLARAVNRLAARAVGCHGAATAMTASASMTPNMTSAIPEQNSIARSVLLRMAANPRHGAAYGQHHGGDGLRGDDRGGGHVT